MREYGKKMVLSLAALLLCVMRPLQVMAATAAAGVATGDETPIIALILCIAGVAIIVVAVKKRK